MYVVDSLLIYTLIIIACLLLCTLVLIACLFALAVTVNWIVTTFNELDQKDNHPPAPQLTHTQKMLLQAQKLGRGAWTLREGEGLDE